MKRLPITLKITLWFTLCMVLLCVFMLVLVGLLSTATTTSAAKTGLIRFVEENADEVEYDDGELEIDDDFEGFRSGMYCLVFLEDGSLITGYAPYPELLEAELEDGSLRPVNAGNQSFLVYDRRITIRNHSDIWLRGLREEGAAISQSAVYTAALVAFPLLVLLAAVGGYLMARRSLRPIQKIHETAEEIGSSGDLSKRIDMGEGSDELHRLAATFNRMFDRLEQNFEAERRFTADASHELRTPVTTILSQCEYAFENAAGEEELYESLAAIERQGYRMKRIIETLLQFTRMEQNTEAIPMGPVDFSGLAETVCREQQELGGRGIALTAAIQPGIQMQGNATLLTRLLENLLRNAFKYGRENGWIKVSLTEAEDAVVLRVADNGIGVPAEDLPKLWTRFYQVDPARSSGGLGLGLAMVKQIAEIHGGTVSASSEEGAGSEFSVTFKKSLQS